MNTGQILQNNNCCLLASIIAGIIAFFVDLSAWIFVVSTTILVAVISVSIATASAPSLASFAA